MQLPQTYMRVILLSAGPMYLYQFRLVHQTAPRPPDSVQLHAFNRTVNPFTRTVANCHMGTAISSILCQTGLSRHL